MPYVLALAGLRIFSCFQCGRELISLISNAVSSLISLELCQDFPLSWQQLLRSLQIYSEFQMNFSLSLCLRNCHYVPLLPRLPVHSNINANGAVRAPRCSATLSYVLMTSNHFSLCRPFLTRLG